MSLALVQGYESSEEEERPTFDSSDDDDDAAVQGEQEASPAPLQTPKSSLLPSPLDAFAEITGPPDFLKHCVKEPPQQLPPASELSDGQDKRGPSTGAVVEAKPLLVTNTPSVVASETEEALPRVLRPQNPPPEDAANLLRMCVQCGVPKTFSGARLICPVCKDRPREEIELDKRKGSKIKDKEKNKRVKGQSSHATWKSETEMQLRQQFD